MTKTMDPREFWEEGYLAYINWTILHPHGLALGFDVDEDGNGTVVIVDRRDDPEGIVWDDDVIPQVAAKLEKIDKIEIARYGQRYDALGYWIQPIPLP